ncbi:hypothetical protein [Caulobacter sp. S45]|uniref:hypothetical protein n=1 Tax=Caulobacter sp. S45 TaxID=1641861 RepID=UPI001575E632|nr:hypothetical protein [Caulobacter sp. S45]
MIEELVQHAARHTGLSLQQSQSALAGCLFLIDKHGDPAKVNTLFEAVPGAAELARQGGMLLGKGGGLMAGLVSKAGGAGGAAMSDGMAMNQQLTRQGVTISDLQKILPLAMGWVKQKTGSDLLRDVLSSVPGLGPLLTSH